MTLGEGIFWSTVLILVALFQPVRGVQVGWGETVSEFLTVELAIVTDAPAFPKGGVFD